MDLREYREQLKGRASLLAAEGLSQTAISREIGVPQQTVSRWLNQLTHNGQPSPSTHSGSAENTRSFYHIADAPVEDFMPPEGIRFPLIIADPPWNVSDVGHKRERTARPNRPFTKDFGSWDAFESNDAYLKACKAWLTSLYAAAADDAFMFFWVSWQQASQILRIAEAVGWKRKNGFVWHKTNPLPMFGNNSFLASFEMALVLVKGDPRFRFAKRRQPHDHYESSQVAGSERVKKHDGAAVNLAQKPLALTQAWVDWTTKRGDWVLDAFSGTGTATVAALNQGRNACVLESDRAAIHQIEARLMTECPAARIWNGIFLRFIWAGGQTPPQ